MSRTINCIHTGETIEFPLSTGPSGRVQYCRFTTANFQESQASNLSLQCLQNRVIQIQSCVGTSEYVAATSIHANSSRIQSLLSPCIEKLNFVSEETISAYGTTFRPDFIRTIENESVIVEIERGKTTDDNMDMLDLWKTHIHPTARHLILVVPVWYQTPRAVKRTFSQVCKRMSPFFIKGNETNVSSLIVVGY